VARQQILAPKVPDNAWRHCNFCDVFPFARHIVGRAAPLDRPVPNLKEDKSMPKTKTPTDAIALLKADHRKVEGLFEKFDSAKSSERKMALAKEICTELMVHCTIEEEIFYPACKEAVEEDQMNEAYVEHDGAKVMIAELLGSSPDQQFYDAKMTVLSEEIKHHVKEEEAPGNGVFAQARKAGLDMDALGERMATRKEQLLEQFKTSGLPAPKTRAFTGHKLDQSKPVEAQA
jgi:Hemerythrin HHE cation binding domain